MLAKSMGLGIFGVNLKLISVALPTVTGSQELEVTLSFPFILSSETSAVSLPLVRTQNKAFPHLLLRERFLEE